MAGQRSFHRAKKYGGLALAAIQLTWEQKVVEETEEEEEARMQARLVCFESDRHDLETPMTSSQRQRVLKYSAGAAEKDGDATAAVSVKKTGGGSVYGGGGEWEDSEEEKEDAAWVALQERDDGEVAPAAAGDDLAMQARDDGEVAPAAAGDDLAMQARDDG